MIVDDIVGITEKPRRLGRGQVNGVGMVPAGTFPTYVSRLSATVAKPTQADHAHRNLSALVGERRPPRLHDPRFGYRDQLAAARMRSGATLAAAGRSAESGFR